MAVNKNYLFFGLALLIVIIDQLTKYLITTSQTIIDLGILKINFVKNFGIGFGLLNFPFLRWILVIITVVIIGIILYYYKDLPNKFFPVFSLSLVLGGALGNVIDRLMYGFVVDFIDFGFWPAFNIADSAVTIGIILLIIYFWKYSNKTRK
jgi:signal peptidase II